MPNVKGNTFNAIAPGTVFGRLTVLEDPGAKAVRCRCSCGEETTTERNLLRKGKTRSCGCLRREVAAEQHYKHGGVGGYLYSAWNSMLQRCENPNLKCFKNYGGRGIKVYPPWRDYATFRDAVGPRPSPKHSIDRIDNEGHYWPGNVKWSTGSEQCRNTRRTKFLVLGGKRRSLLDWAERKGLSPHVIRARLKAGASDREALRV